MRGPGELITRFRSRVHVVDGGLATELEKRGHDISGRLWSAQVLLDDPAAIEQLHYDYLRAGADVIITSSYQLTFQGMAEAGYSHRQAENALRNSVEVAVKARERYLAGLDEAPPDDSRPLIAASIGPYGAYLADGSEYTANYGLTFPAGTTTLREFHAERLTLLAGSGADLLALETFPTPFEATACIQLAETVQPLPIMLSFTCRDGYRISSGDPLRQASEMLARSPCLVALGVNCTPPTFMASLIGEIAGQWSGPIVVYPNSGERWDAEHRRWVGEGDADHFAAYARQWIEAGASLVGGCCRTGPEHIAELGALADEANSRRGR